MGPLEGRTCYLPARGTMGASEHPHLREGQGWLGPMQVCTAPSKVTVGHLPSAKTAEPPGPFAPWFIH